ncbi:UNVERIFIED_CONTAM: hypothetical protein NCL1_41152 [Trichonephila clavipes]
MGEHAVQYDPQQTIDFIFEWQWLVSDQISLSQECDEADVETWMACDAEDCGFQTLNDDEIVTSVQEESNPVDDETDEDEDNNNENSKGP